MSSTNSTNCSNKGIKFNSFSKIREGEGTGVVLLRGAGFVFLLKALGAGGAIFLQILLARIMGVAQYGLYVYILTWINLLILPSSLGLGTALIRFISAYRAQQDWGLLRGIMVRSLQYVSMASILVSGITAVIVWLLRHRFEPDYVITFWIALLSLPLLALNKLLFSGLRALKHVVMAEFPDAIVRPLMLGIIAFVLFLHCNQVVEAKWMMLIHLFGVVMLFFIQVLLLNKALPEQVKKTPLICAKSTWLRVSLPLLLLAGMNMLLNRTDILMVGAFLGSDQAGIYAAAAQISGVVVFGLIVVNAVVAPMIAELYSIGQLPELQRLLTIAARSTFTFVLVASLGLAAFGQDFLGLFGEVFVIGSIPLLILLGGQIINALAGSVGYLMTMTGHQEQAAYIIVLSTGINIFLNWILIPRFGLIGAAIATAITTVFWNMGMLIYVYKRLGINPTVLARLKA